MIGSGTAAVEVAVLGIRHHGPGSARSLLTALTDHLVDNNEAPVPAR